MNEAVKDPSTWIIIRQVVPHTQETMIKGIDMAFKAIEVLEKVYMEGGKSLSLHIPPEDLSFQEQMGGTSSMPLLVGLFTPEGELIHGYTVRELACFSYLDELVAPLFTSRRRLLHFIDVLEENLYIIPEYELGLCSFNHKLGQLISQGSVVINPLPQLFILSMFPVYNKEENSILMVDVRDPTDIE